MYADHRMVTSVQDRRITELRKLAARRRETETPEPGIELPRTRRFSLRALVRRLVRGGQTAPSTLHQGGPA